MKEPINSDHLSDHHLQFKRILLSVYCLHCPLYYLNHHYFTQITAITTTTISNLHCLCCDPSEFFLKYFYISVVKEDTQLLYFDFIK